VNKQQLLKGRVYGVGVLVCYRHVQCYQMFNSGGARLVFAGVRMATRNGNEARINEAPRPEMPIAWGWALGSDNEPPSPPVLDEL